ncbi:putative GIY-YIG catalytic domain protein [gamma proteobacterium NOR5-3]|nr:putative GIY-YIG catalytic domain protein [gamma proteobacterium NOR5-3]
MSESLPWSVYILRCADGSLYTGVTRDLARRLRQHNGELVGGAQYTRGRRPVEAIWAEECEDRSCAQVREAQIKRLTRSEKLSLVRSLPRETPAV